MKRPKDRGVASRELVSAELVRRCKKGDESAQLPVVHIWRFRGDDEVCRLQILTDTLQGARMLGKA